MAGVYVPLIICGIGVSEYPAHINKVIPFPAVVPFHRIPSCLMVSGQLHQAEVKEMVPIHINQPSPQSVSSCFTLSSGFVFMIA